MAKCQHVTIVVMYYIYLIFDVLKYGGGGGIARNVTKKVELVHIDPKYQNMLTYSGGTVFEIRIIYLQMNNFLCLNSQTYTIEIY